VFAVIPRWLTGLCLAAMLALMAGLSGCASWFHGDDMPLLRLSPASLGRELTVVQRLDVQAAGQSRSLDVALEVDAESVRMAVMQLGHTVARLTWDGAKLEQSLAPGWPKVVSAERVLSDLQLVWWPAAQVRSALPADWTLTESTQARELRHGERLVTSVQVLGPGHIELVQHTQGYTVQVHSQGATPVFASPALSPASSPTTP
jgi:hypothetical protein